MTVDEQLNDIAKKLSSPAFVAKAGTMAADYIRMHIEAGSFAPLSPVTQQFRGYGEPLKDTHRLVNSITGEIKDQQTASVGTTLIQAPILNNGGTITAKKNWLFIPGPRMRYYMRKFGYSAKDVLNGLRSSNFYVYRVGRTIVYRKKEKKAEPHVAFYLKKSVTIPARPFFYLTDEEAEVIFKECSQF